MKLTVNGKDQDHDTVKTVADLLGLLDVPRERVAVMVNGTVIRRAELGTTTLREGDTVEIITMVGGG